MGWEGRTENCGSIVCPVLGLSLLKQSTSRESIEEMGDQNPSTRAQLYWNTLLKIPGQVISFVISIIVARSLTPNDFGVMGIAMMLIGYANLFTNFGLGEAIIQKRIKDKDTLTSIFTFNITFSICLAILFVVSSGFIADFFKSIECKDVIKVLSLIFIVSAFAAVPQAMLRRDMNFRTLSLTDLISTLLMSFITLALALNEFGYWSLVFGQLIPAVLITVFLCVKVRWIPVLKYEHTTMKDILNFGMWNFIRAQLGFLAQHTDRFIIGKWLGAVNLGFYDKALTISETPYNSVTMNINGVMFSSFSRSKHDGHQIQQLLRKSLALLSFINFPIHIGMIVIAPYFVHVLLGDKWLPMVVPMQIVLFSCLFKTFTGITASLNVAVGKYKDHTRRILISVIVFTVVCLLLLRLGIVGVALGYLIFNLLQVILSMDISLQSTHLSWKDVWASARFPIFSATCMFLITETVAWMFLWQQTTKNMLLLIAVGICAYCFFVLFICCTMTRNLRKLTLMDIKDRIQVVFSIK